MIQLLHAWACLKKMNTVIKKDKAPFNVQGSIIYDSYDMKQPVSINIWMDKDVVSSWYFQKSKFSAHFYWVATRVSEVINQRSDRECIFRSEGG